MKKLTETEMELKKSIKRFFGLINNSSKKITIRMPVKFKVADSGST